MTKTQPIKDKAKLNALKNYYRDVDPNHRNHTLIIVALNTALRISDILTRKWGDFYDSNWRILSHLDVREKKTGKTNIIALNSALVTELEAFRLNRLENGHVLSQNDYIFSSNRGDTPLSRSQAFRIIKQAAVYCGMGSYISCHSMRKTFGYHAWKNGVPPALLMDIFNHSSFKITKNYLCIDQDDKDSVFITVNL